MRLLLFSLLMMAGFAGNAQRLAMPDLPDNRWYVGAGLGLGVANGFSVGATPEFGRTIARAVDVGVTGNINYYSLRAANNFGVRVHSTNFGIGGYVRIYPIPSLFVTAQPEYNWITQTQRNENVPGEPDVKFKFDAPSILLGIGYGRRIIGQSSFYTMLLFDANSDPESPYRDGFGAAIPILRTGFTIYLPSKQAKRSSN